MGTPPPDDAAAQPPAPAGAVQDETTLTAAPAGATRRVAHDDTASRATDRHPMPTDDPALTRADVAWERSLTAAAEAWFLQNPPAPTADPAAPEPAAVDYRAETEAFLDTLPGGATATIEWGDPDGHLGGVWIPGSETIILNAARLDGKLQQTKDVLRHEIGHVHQNRAMAAAGVSLADFEARLDALFDGQGIERSADAIALLLGAGTVRYASTFTGAQYDAARAILDDRVP